MKKWLIGLSALLILSVAGTYIFIPATIKISETAIVNCKINYVDRYLFNSSQWVKWWPETDSGKRSTSQPSDSTFEYNGCSYRVSNLYYHKMEVFISNNKGLNAVSTVNILDLNNGSVGIQWQDDIQTDLNPVNRIRNLQFAKLIKKNMAGILSNASEFLNKKENIYSTDIREVVIKDTSMISLTYVFTGHPGMPEVYEAIDKVREYISGKDAKESGYPMLNIRKSEDNRYIMMVAIPTDKVLDGDEKFKLKRMPVTRILVTETKGGPYTIRNAFDQMQNYSNDYHLGSSALPFESLVTNRINVPDTTQWITRLYFPIY